MGILAAIFLACLVVLLCAVIILVLTELKVTIQLIHDERDHLLCLSVTAWYGLIKVKKEWQFVQLILGQNPSIAYQGETESHDQPFKQKKERLAWAKIVRLRRRARELLKQVHALKEILKPFGRKVTVLKWQWHSSLGTGLADETGVLTGLAWCFKSLITSCLQRYLNWGAKPEVSVRPNFQKPSFSTHFACMIRFRIGYAILAGIRILLNLRKRRDQSWKSIRFKA